MIRKGDMLRCRVAVRSVRGDCQPRRPRMPTYERQLRSATDEVSAARAALDRLVPSALEPTARRDLAALKRALTQLLSTSPGPFESPAGALYSGVRLALQRLDDLARHVPSTTRTVIDDAVFALHRAEEALNEPVFRTPERR